MLAHHPTTGEPIRILRTDPHITTDLKTIVWVRSTFKPGLWDRWFPVVTEPEAVALCGSRVFAVVFTTLSDMDAWAPLLPTLSPDCLFVAPRSIVETLHRIHNNDRTLVWEEMYGSYPFVGEPLSSNDSATKAIVSLAHILRMNRIVCALTDEEKEKERAQIAAWQQSCGGVIQTVATDSDDSCVPRTWLIQQYFKHSTNRRTREVNACLEKNIACPLIDHILLLNETEYPDMPKSPKIQITRIGHRLTYYDVFVAAKNIPSGDFVMFANSDIWFNESLSYLWQIQLKERRMFLALLRWEDPPNATPQLFGPRPDSQDSWILARDSIDFEPDIEFGFPFGKSGCDNAIALIMMRKKFLIVNPAYSIRTFHVHASNIRNYDPKDVLYRPQFLYIDPSHIQVSSAQKSLSANTKRWVHPGGESFSRAILSLDTFQTIQHDELGKLLPHDRNVWTPTRTEDVYHFQNAFVTPSGLIFDFQRLYVGPHPQWTSAWENESISSLSQTLYVPQLVAIPCDKKCQSSLSAWTLRYLPRALELRELVQQKGFETPEFLVPQIDGLGDFLQDCRWGTSELTVVPITGLNYYSNNVWAVPPETPPITMEDVARLRSLLPLPSEEESRPVIVFCLDDMLTQYWVEDVVRILPKGPKGSKGWVTRTLSESDPPSVRRTTLAGAAWMVGGGQGLDWMWYMPQGATVVDMRMCAERAHLAGACDLRYVGIVLPSVPMEQQRQHVLERLGQSIQSFGFKDMLKAKGTQDEDVIPTIVLPAEATGIWAHAGDTFREMAHIWAERGYVKLQHSTDTVFCWWGGIGEVLLYDRPTLRWWTDVPSYQFALFGNCPPPGKGDPRQSVWSFWPRSPRAVEQVGQTWRNYESRAIRSLFLGKVENGVQRANRTQHNWADAVDLFSMPIDTTGAAYPYTQSEYLNKLSNAKFGLCLPGFGPKCNREIEYFACGTVPIVTDGVDMTHYLVPPKEGVHYLRANTPQDVRRIVETTSPERWTSLSSAGREWWKAFASAEGLFRLTWACIVNKNG